MKPKNSIRFFKSNRTDDPGFELTTDEVAEQFWASDEAVDWVTNHRQYRLERLALNWVNENVGQWDNIPADWALIFDAIHVAMPRGETTDA